MVSHDLRVRREHPDDRAAVRDVLEQSFGGGKVADLADALRELPGALSFVAEDNGTVVGQAMFTRSLLDAPARLVDVQVLSPLGVLPSWQGRGVGTQLVRHGLDKLAKAGEALVFLEGDPGYYVRFGFRPGGELAFRRPSLRIPEPAFQVFTLPAYEPWMTGTLVYADTFWKLDCVGLRD